MSSDSLFFVPFVIYIFFTPLLSSLFVCLVMGNNTRSRMTTSIESSSREETVTDNILTREETVTDILLIRLPVRSLLRFKCVCKSWRDLIKSESFIKKHYNSKSNRPRLWICKFGVDYRPSPPLRAMNFFLFPEKLIPGIVPANQRIFRWEDVNDFRGILGPIDGLYLIEKGHFLCNVRFAWWNPATKQCRLIPTFAFELQRHFDEHERVAGIGYDAVSKDYKVLSLRTYMNEEKRQVHPRTFAAVYSTNNDSWKHIEPNFPHENNLTDSLDCTHINGIYHWLCLTKENVYVIAAFNFTTELFEWMEGPPIPYDNWGTLMMRGESLAAMSCEEMAQPFTSCYGIFARIIEDKWIKIFSVNPPITWHWPIGIWEYDKYIYEMTQTYNLVYYDHTAKQTTDFGLVFTDIGSGSVWPITYKESLYPVKRKDPAEEDNTDYFFIDF